MAGPTVASNPGDESPYGSRPVPDPTKLTTDAVNAATDQWRRDLAAMARTIEARLDAMDTAADLHRQFADDAIKTIPIQILHARNLTDEKFASIGRQFTERDTRTEQTQRTSKEALDAALLAAKELVNTQNESNAKSAEKTEASFTKQIEQIGDLIRTGAAATAQQIADLKERIDRSEGGERGRSTQVVETRSQQNTQAQVLGVALVAIGILASVLIAYLANR